VKLTINFVWVGAKQLGWLERFLIYAWRRWNCEVYLFSYRGPDVQHGPESLGLPDGVCRLIDLPDILAQDDNSYGMGMDDVEYTAPLRQVLRSWCTERILPWDSGGQTQIYNMVDLTKSYLAATRTGMVIDLKIGPSSHLSRYIEAGVFENHFVSFERAGITENQCMGSMRLASDFRLEYARHVMGWLFQDRCAVGTMQAKPHDRWFNEITGGHNRACVFGKRKLNFLDISTNGKAVHSSKYRISNADVDGVSGEKSYGPLRNFKSASDQTNKSGSVKTALIDQVKMRDLTFREINAAENAGKINIDAPGMPTIGPLLALLERTRAVL
jgi:hypothetical protein